jgi:lysophospholipase L1-like esterase
MGIQRPVPVGSMAAVGFARDLIIALAARSPGGGGVPGPVRPVHVGAGETLVSLLGDSLTQGWVSANFVHLAQQRLGSRGFRFQNAGVGGDFLYNLRTRLEPVIESHPHSIVVLAGTNDAQHPLLDHGLAQTVQQRKRLPEPPSLQWFGDNLVGLIQSLRSVSPRVAVCSIPPLGEDLESKANRLVRRYNGAILAGVEETGVSYLPVFEEMEAYLNHRRQHSGKPYTGPGLIPHAMWDHFVLRKDWDAIGAANGFLLLTDGIHLNRHGANIMAELIEGWLTGYRTSEPPASRPA